MSEIILNNGLHGEFSKTLHRKFMKAAEEFELLKDGDRVCVCVSGGKDSLLLAALFREYEKHGKAKISARYLLMDAGFSEDNLKLINENAKRLCIPLESFKTKIFERTENANNACFLCSKMRRGHLYKKAKELCCNKIALGHHFDDVIESTLMGMIYGGQTQTMLPKLRSAHFEGMELIRPLFYVREKDVISWGKSLGLTFSRCECALAKSQKSSKRERVKRLIAELSAEDPQIEQNIFRAVCGVRLDSIISYKDKAGKVHHFLDDY